MSVQHQLLPDAIRFIADVDAAWRVRLTCTRDPAWTREREMRRLRGSGDRSYPAAADTDVLEVDEIEALQTAVIGRRADQGQIQSFGKHLFAALLGWETWSEMTQRAEELQAKHLELALSWAKEDVDLHRLTWELMHDGDTFLAGTRKVAVAITRLVDVNVVAPPLSVPPRILFVVGTSIADPAVRPGAELHALLRQARAGRAIHHRLLERASPSELRQAVRTFAPDVVHFICHGGVDPGSGRVYLELRTDEEGQDPQRFGEQLLADLNNDGRLPTIVVLSACFTAGAGEAEGVVLAGGHETAPLATWLVSSGIPIVLGMSGRVSDLTCRLFAREFGMALIRGESLVKATARARQAAFADGRDPVTTTDWALPCVFMAQGVSPDYVPVPRAESDVWASVERWTGRYRRDPVFCGREEFLCRFQRMLDAPSESSEGRVLAAFVDERQSRYGSSRLLCEFAIHALMSRHIPVLPTFKPAEEPRDDLAFARVMRSAILNSRDDLHLGEPATPQLDAVLAYERNGTSEPMTSAIRNELQRSAGVTRRAIRLAIQADLRKLRADARAEIPFFTDSASRLVVLLDDVDRYGPVVNLLLDDDGLLSDGLGSADAPVPVALTFAIVDGCEPKLRDIAGGQFNRPWLDAQRLGRFADGEDLLATETVLLHPFMTADEGKFSGVPWAFNHAASDEVREDWEKRFKERLRGNPARFYEEWFYYTVEDAHKAGFLVKADDETWLAKLDHR
jgi:hypothetical protein